MKPTLVLWKSVLVLVLLLSLTLVGCARASQQRNEAADVTITLAVQPDPPSVGPCHLTATLTGADGAPIDNARLQIKGDMTHAGMQPVLAEVDTGDEGKYETPFEWTMGGDWIVTVTATLPDGRTTARQFYFTVEGDMDMGMEQDMQMEATETP
jgi:hypothetical protein